MIKVYAIHETYKTIYTNRVIPFINKQVIKVLTGQRRVGKSYVMLQLMENIEATDSNANIVYVNMEVDDFSHDVIFGQNKDGIMQKNLLEFLSEQSDNQ